MLHTPPRCQSNLLHIITQVLQQMLTVCWHPVELISMIECYIDDSTVIASLLAQGRRQLEFISNALGRRQENTHGLTAGPSGRTYTLSFTCGQFKTAVHCIWSVGGE